MNTISLTLPMDRNTLTRASKMLQGLAADLNQGDSFVAGEAEPKATEVFGPQHGAASNPSLFGAQPTETSKPVTPTTVTDAHTSTPTTSEAVTPASVELDGEGLPWDARIHASSKTKLAKEPHGWKKKRGVDVGAIAQVEAELRAAMIASPTSPVILNEQTTPVNIAGPTPRTPVQPVAPVGAISTFPQLMARITSSGIDPARVTAAVNKQGLQSLPLLAARPGLISAVAAELFPGG